MSPAGEVLFQPLGEAPARGVALMVRRPLKLRP